MPAKNHGHGPFPQDRGNGRLRHIAVDMDNAGMKTVSRFLGSKKKNASSD
jgi:hypothetical protein